MNRYVGHAFQELPLLRIRRALCGLAQHTLHLLTNEAEAKSLRDEGATLHPGDPMEFPEKPDGQGRKRHVKRFPLAEAPLDTALPVLRRDVPDRAVAVELDVGPSRLVR